jgi:hypothetical protein
MGNPFLRVTPQQPKHTPTADEVARGRTRIRRIVTPGSRPGSVNPAGIYGDAPAVTTPNNWINGQPTIHVGPAETEGYQRGRNTKPRRRRSSAERAVQEMVEEPPTFGPERYEVTVNRTPTKRGGSRVEVVDAVPIPDDEPAREAGREPSRPTVLQRAQRSQALPFMEDGGPSEDMIGVFTRNYRRTHRAQLSNAQLALMARYLHAQSGARGALFRDGQ